MASLRGDAPLVRLHFNVHDDDCITSTKVDDISVSHVRNSSNDSEESWVVTHDSIDSILKENNEGLSMKALSLMTKICLSRTHCIDLSTSEKWSKKQDSNDRKIVTVNFEVFNKYSL